MRSGVTRAELFTGGLKVRKFRVALASLIATLGLSVALFQAPAEGASSLGLGSGSLVVARLWENADISGGALVIYHPTNCTATTTDADFKLASMPSGWNDIVSAVMDDHSCDVNIFIDSNFVGAKGYVNYGIPAKYVGDAWNDKTSSFKVS